MTRSALLSGIVAATVALALVPAQAQHQGQARTPNRAATPAPDPAQRCRTLLAALPFTAGQDGATFEPAGEDCLARHVRFGVGQAGYRVDSLRLHGIPAGFDTMPDALPNRPLALRVEARGITFSPRIDNRKMAWMIAQQQVPFDLTLDASYDPAARRATLDEFTLDGEVLGHVLLRLTAEGVAPGPFSDVFGAGGLTILHADLDSRRFLTGFALSPLLPLLPDDDPGAAVEAGKLQAVAGLRAMLPQTGASAATIDALAGFVADFPHPQHPFTIDVSAASPVTAKAIGTAGDGPSQLTALLRQLTVTASYAGALR